MTDELVHRVAEDLRVRYGVDGGDVRTLGSRLPDPAGVRSAEASNSPSASPKHTGAEPPRRTGNDLQAT